MGKSVCPMRHNNSNLSKIDKTKEKGDSNVNMEHVVKVENRVRRVIRDVGDESLIVEGFFEGYPERVLFRVPKRIGTNPINGRIYSRITSIG